MKVLILRNIYWKGKVVKQGEVIEASQEEYKKLINSCFASKVEEEHDQPHKEEVKEAEEKEEKNEEKDNDMKKKQSKPKKSKKKC